MIRDLRRRPKSLAARSLMNSNWCGHEFIRPDLLETAMTHKSYYHENRSAALTPERAQIESMFGAAQRTHQRKAPLKISRAHNEKLEFLGDAVLDLVLADLLMERFPELDEGRLSKRRASLVNETVLSDLGRKLGIHQLIKLGKGEAQSNAGENPRILASAFEALIGAIFTDAGYDQVKKWIEKQYSESLELVGKSSDFEEDFKTRLQEVVQNRKQKLPEYKVTLETGPSHQRQFEVELYLEGHFIAKGKGKSKKLAEQEAAREALAFIKKGGFV